MRLSNVKSRDRLQAELMQGENKYAIFPHADKRVWFVFNRHSVWTNLYAAYCDKYPINAMGCAAIRSNRVRSA